MFTLFVPVRIVHLKISLPRKCPEVKIGSNKPVSITENGNKPIRVSGHIIKQLYVSQSRQLEP